MINNGDIKYLNLAMPHSTVRIIYLNDALD